jgi:cyclopropane-fatty-acyl-phospholipid synthase
LGFAIDAPSSPIVVDVFLRRHSVLKEHLLKEVETKLRRENLPLAVTLWNGETIAGTPSPSIELTLKSPSAMSLFLHPNLSNLAESYVRQEIDVRGDIRHIIRLLLKIFQGNGTAPSWSERLNLFRHTRASDSKAVRYHYDVSNDFYKLWLDKRRVYSCAYFKTLDDSLDLAQEQKLDHLCKKLNLQPGERLLDIGCGWGALIFWAAERYGARCVGITLSEQQYAYVQEQIAAQGLQDRMEVRLQDYRDVPEDALFDKVVSVGMFEHVGVHMLPAYFSKIFRLLKPGGVVMNHGITSAAFDDDQGSSGRDFIEKYVFPDGELTHVSKVIEVMARQGLEVLDTESLRRHYAQTLWHWVTGLEAHEDEARRLVGEDKYRIWRAYLGGFAYAFEAHWNNIYQILAARPLPDGSIDYPLTREHVYR